MSRYRQDFPLLTNREDIVYLDNAATTQKPQVVLDAVRAYYETINANVHRGVHQLSDAATAAFESSRDVVASFVNAASSDEIVWTRGTTEAINLVANTYGSSNLRKGDHVLISEMEHHSNIVPWQLLCTRTGAELRVINVTESGELDLEHFSSLLSNRTKLVAIAHVSNVLGTINPVKQVADLTHKYGAVLVLDGAQAVAHGNVDVQAIDCDFYAFSGHKVFGPTGMGALYGKRALLNAMPPWQGGGEMIEHVTFAKTTYQNSPYRFEAGTPNIAGAIGMKTALEYVQQLDRKSVLEHEADLLLYAEGSLKQIEGLRIIGTALKKVPVVSFMLKSCHPSDVGVMLDHQGIAVRTGHHCAIPLMEKYKIPGTIRASFSLYNSRDDVDRLVQGLHKAKDLLLS